MTPKHKKIAFWITTTLFSLAMLMGGVLDLIHADTIVESMTHLGYPLYVATLLGVFKLLGVGALLAPPRFSRLKEWAYAGFSFDLIGAVFSHASVGDPIPQIMPPVVLLGIMAASYFLRPFRQA